MDDFNFIIQGNPLTSEMLMIGGSVTLESDISLFKI
jgi:hypothetical protein